MSNNSMKRLILFFSLLPFAGGKIYAQKTYAYVRQNGKKLEQLGTAAFDVGGRFPAEGAFC